MRLRRPLRPRVWGTESCTPCAARKFEGIGPAWKRTRRVGASESGSAPIVQVVRER